MNKTGFGSKPIFNSKQTLKTSFKTKTYFKNGPKLI